jgi:hypothetical protein
MTELNIEYAPKTGNEELDPWNDRLVEYLRKYLSQPFDRGDPSSGDFAVGDLTTDGTWNDLDLSSIVPEDAIAVILNVVVKDADGVGSNISFRKNGNSNTVNIASVQTQVANLNNDAQRTVFCDTDTKIEYKADDVSWTTISITVSGWYK